jgi:hypothetical protein
VPTTDGSDTWSEHIAADLHEIAKELRKITDALAEYAPTLRAYLDNPALRWKARLGGRKDGAS